jgi:hypothetical protein
VNHRLNIIRVDLGELLYHNDNLAKLVRQLQNFIWRKGKPSKVSNANHIFGGKCHRRTSKELLWQCKRLGAYSLANATASNALGANTNRSDFSIGERNLAILQVWSEPTLGDTSNFGTNATQVLGLTTDLNLISDGRNLLTNFARLGHDLPSNTNESNLKVLTFVPQWGWKYSCPAESRNIKTVLRPPD